MNIPLDLSRTICLPSRRLLSLLLKVKNEPGVLASIAGTIACLGVNIVHAIVHTATDNPGVGYILLYLDLGGRALEEKLIRELEKLRNIVYEIKTAKTIIDGVISDVFHFPLTVGENRVIIMALPVLEGFLAITRKYESLKALLWYQGFEAGVKTVKNYRKCYNARKVDEILTVLKARAQALGWSRLEILYANDSERVYTLRLYNNWECEIIRNWGLTKEPQSNFIRGVIAGIFTEIYHKLFDVREEKCIAMGDPYCEFHVRERKITMK